VVSDPEARPLVPRFTEETARQTIGLMRGRDDYKIGEHERRRVER
jgi:hypothetical protein